MSAVATPIDDIDIFRAAKLLIEKHGDEAAITATKRATELLDAGDVDGYAVWKRILNAVKELLTEEPLDNAIIH